MHSVLLFNSLVLQAVSVVTIGVAVTEDPHGQTMVTNRGATEEEMTIGEDREGA